nr:hypothetical protein [Tanacetum cinerariifolium]
DEAKKKTQERDRNSKPSVMTPARFQRTPADSKPNPKSTNHSSRSLPMSKSSCVTMPTMPKADHSKSPSSFPDHTRFFCSTCNKRKVMNLSSWGILINRELIESSTRVIMESIHVNFDELPLMASDQLSSDPAPECQTIALNHDSLSPASQRQANVPQADKIVTTSNELDLLFSPMFDELLNGSSKVVSKSSAVSAADAPIHRQHNTTPLHIHTTPAPTCQIPTLAQTVISSKNINQAETYAENDQVADDEFINILSNPVQDQGETSTRHVDSSNMHTFY